MRQNFTRKQVFLIAGIGIVLLAILIAIVVVLTKKAPSQSTLVEEAMVVQAGDSTEEPKAYEDEKPVAVTPPEEAGQEDETEPEVADSQEKKETKTQSEPVEEKIEQPLEEPEPEISYTAEEYYQEHSQEIIEVVDVQESEEVQSEKDVVTDLQERGFVDFAITFDSSMDGEYSETTEAAANSSQKHPMYQTFFVTDNGDIWSIFVINGAIFANPVFFNLESDLEGQVLFSESEELTSYDDVTNQFYVTVPEESAVVVKVVDRIDAATLNKLTYEEIRNYE